MIRDLVRRILDRAEEGIASLRVVWVPRTPRDSVMRAAAVCPAGVL